jgi:murein DD-endopeptidase MepM/ murein hydrolase activator NlpD
VVRIQQASGGSNGWWSTGYQYWYIYGAFDAVHSPSALYWYPFSGTYTINQGNGGTFSHGVGTSDEYAIDFGTPANTPIYAARAGYVSFVIYDQQYSKFDTSVCPGGATGCTTPGSEANMVVVTHPDDTQALYVHFVQVRATMCWLGISRIAKRPPNVLEWSHCQ